MRIALDVQHRGKPDKPADRGAHWLGVDEVDVSALYAAEIDRELRRLGHEVHWLGCGGYAERWALSDVRGADVYLACHLDAGLAGRAGDRGLVLYDHRSPRGAALAGPMAQSLAVALGWSVHSLPCRPDDDGEPRDEDYSEPYACIRGVKAVALVLEPGFLDGAKGTQLWTDPALRHRTCVAIGQAVAVAIDAWGRA